MGDRWIVALVWAFISMSYGRRLFIYNIDI